MDVVMVGLLGALGALLFGPLVRLRANRLFSKESDQVFARALLDAGARGDSELRMEHLALNLLAEPVIAQDLEARGVVLMQLYADLEQLLPPRLAEPTRLSAHAMTRPLAAFIRGFRTFRVTTIPPSEVFQALVASAPFALRAVLDRHGVTSPSRAPEADASDAPRDDLGVYRNDHRRTDEAERDTNVVFWNDHKTTQELVRQLLRGHFDIPEPHATRLMLLIHRDGRAVIGAFVPSEAKLLVDLALAHARAAGYPLAITLESKTAPTHPASP